MISRKKKRFNISTSGILFGGEGYKVCICTYMFVKHLFWSAKNKMKATICILNLILSMYLFQKIKIILFLIKIRFIMIFFKSKVSAYFIKDVIHIYIFLN